MPEITSGRLLAALKALGLTGNALVDRLKDFRRSDLAAGLSPAILDNLCSLTTQPMAWRSSSRKVHGAVAGTPVPSPALVALAIH
jgi:hypothetical protein